MLAVEWLINGTAYVRDNNMLTNQINKQSAVIDINFDGVFNEEDQDYGMARKYYELAADQGDAIAQYNLGTYYFFGFGVDQDYSEALRLFRLAAEQGYANGIFAVGECYYLGTGVVKDLEIAAEWYQKALDAGFEPRDEEEAEHLKELIPGWGPTAAEESGTETVEDSSSRSIGMYATSGFSISLVQHIKEHN